MSHPRTTTGLLVGLCGGAVAAWSLGGSTGTGVLLGFVLGAAATCFGLAWQAHWMRVAPARAMRAQIEAFLVKLGLVLVFALLFRFVSAVGEQVDWRTFLVAYAAAVALLLPLGTWEVTLRSAARGVPAAPSRSAP